MTLLNERHISRRTLLIGGGVMLVGAGGVAWWWANRSQTSPQRILHTFNMNVATLAWSPKALLLAIFDDNFVFQVWNMENYTVSHSVSPFAGNMHEGLQFIAWSPDGRSIASYDSTHYFRIWDMINWSWRAAPMYQATFKIPLAWSPDNRYLAVGDDHGNILVFDVSTRSINNATSTFQKHTGAITALAWSPDGTNILSASWDGTVKIWNVSTGETRITYRGHAEYPVTVMAQSPNGKLVASAIGPLGTDPYDRPPGPKAIQVWSTTTGVLISSYHGHTTYVNTLAWSPGGDLVASAAGRADNTEHAVHVWQPQQSFNTYIYEGHARPITDLSWSPDGRSIASASLDGTVQIWQPIVMRSTE